ncbi:MAG: branched-chain amino acid transaminase [Nitrospiria bacterium]
MIKETSHIWMDGKMVPWKDATVHILTHTLHYGLGVFEGIRCYKGDAGTAIFRLKEHTERLFRSARVVQMEIPFSEKAVVEAITETVRINQLEEGYIRPLAYIGYGEMGLYAKNANIQLSIAVWPWGTYLGEEGLKKGIRVCVSSFARHHVNISMTRAKVTGYYVNSQLAKREAKENGFDEAVLLDTDGFVTEGPGENIFIVRKGILKTTPMSSSILEGITRETILQLAQEKNIKVAEERFTRDDLYMADEAFFTGTAAEVTPIREVDGRIIGKGEPGPVTQVLQESFFDIVRNKSKAHQNWLTFI